MKKKNYKLLWISILLDAIGMLSFVIPYIGEFSDVVWAPVSSYIMYKMYKGMEGKIASVVSFVEEAGFFGTDIVPTFTLMWIYKNFINKN
ncbi:MAG: hypothetical protein ACWA42_10205 [Lutibacter sp.]